MEWGEQQYQSGTGPSAGATSSSDGPAPDAVDLPLGASAGPYGSPDGEQDMGDGDATPRAEPKAKDKRGSEGDRNDDGSPSKPQRISRVAIGYGAADKMCESS